MSSSEHPYYDELTTFLRGTLEWIERELREPLTAYGGDKASQRALSKQNLDYINALQAARESPFVARVDMVDGDGAETLYIGKQALPKRQIYSWASELASRLYYQPELRENERAEMVLDVLIEGAQIQTIHNRYVSPARADRLAPAQLGDGLLLQLLRESRTKLRDIVATIQADQDRIIRTPAEQLLVVQGVPGSGKTSIALHRVAYLLYRHGKEGLEARDILILGPNRLFLGHISAILPSLGERHVPQKTFDEWTIELLGDRPQFEPLEAALEQLLDATLSPERRAMHYHAARAKGSLEMAEVLDAYVAELGRLALERLNEPLQCRFSLRALRRREVTVERRVEQLRALLAGLAAEPLNRQRERFEELLVRELVREAEPQLTQLARGAGARELEDAQLRDLQEEASRQVRQYLSQRQWTRENPVMAYRRLLRTPNLLRRMVGHRFAEREVEFILEDAPPAPQPLRASDLAAVMYLKIRLDGLETSPYAHIVIDEAQDLSPLHYRVLRAYSRNQSLTVLGDTGQSIYGHQGISDWSQIGTALGTRSRELQVEKLTRSYRSTRQILQYGARVLRRSGLNEGPQVDPFRDGTAVVQRITADAAAYLEDLTAALADVRTRWASVAIVARTAQACRRLHEQLQAAGVGGLQLLTDRQQLYEGGTVLLPAYLTKGMEFDAVIVADADAASYAPDALHARLLYVALTRAAHELHVHGHGRPTPLLDERSERIALTPLLNGALAVQLTTVAQHAAVLGRPTDWYIEQLALQDRLMLLERGLIDRGLLQVLIDERATPPPGESDDDEAGPELPDGLAAALRETAQRVAAIADEQTQQERMASTLVYGLVRNPLRQAGVELSDGRPAYEEQIRLLALLVLAEQQGRPIESGARWTTAQAVVTQLAPAQQARGRQWLSGLLAAGIVESRDVGGRQQLRIVPGWVGRLARYTLGQPGAGDETLAGLLPRPTITYPPIMDGTGAG